MKLAVQVNHSGVKFCRKVLWVLKKTASIYFIFFRWDYTSIFFQFPNCCSLYRYGHINIFLQFLIFFCPFFGLFFFNIFMFCEPSKNWPLTFKSLWISLKKFFLKIIFLPPPSEPQTKNIKPLAWKLKLTQKGNSFFVKRVASYSCDSP